MKIKHTCLRALLKVSRQLIKISFSICFCLENGDIKIKRNLKSLLDSSKSKS